MDRVQQVQEWTHAHTSAHQIGRALILPYFESLASLAAQSRRAKADFGYIGSNLAAARNDLTPKTRVSEPCKTLDEIVDQIQFHVERMRSEPLEAQFRAELDLQSVFSRFLE